MPMHHVIHEIRIRIHAFTKTQKKEFPLPTTVLVGNFEGVAWYPSENDEAVSGWRYYWLSPLKTRGLYARGGRTDGR